MKKKLLILAADNLTELGRLSFAGLVIAGIISDNPYKLTLIVGGGICCFILLAAGMIIKAKNLE
jgi:hypothetical protein